MVENDNILMLSEFIGGFGSNEDKKQVMLMYFKKLCLRILDIN